MPQSKVKPSPQEKQIDNHKEAMSLLRGIMDWSPKELFKQLDYFGYIGQEETRQKLCLMAYRHIRRLKDHYLKDMPLDLLPPKSNMLLAGPTGCGKSYLSELLFGKIIKLPVVSVDMTEYVETGYMGKYVSEILFDLYNAAMQNICWAKMGICVLDEFDKLSGSGSNIRFGGAGTTKDVSGYGVQRGLLKLIEGGKHELSSRGSHETTIIDTDCIGFVACGAFSGLREMVQIEHESDFGFKPDSKKRTTKEIVPDDISFSIELFNKFGFLPELIGRFNAIAYLNPLGKKDLIKILKHNVLPKYQQEFKREGQELQLPNNIIEDIVEKAIERKTGARGITLLLTEYFEKQAFELFGQKCNDSDIVLPF